MRIVVLLLALIVSGCQTPHQYCLRNARLYKNYEQCYAEESRDQERRSHAFRSWGANQQMLQNSQRTCNSVPNGLGGFRTVCN